MFNNKVFWSLIVLGCGIMVLGFLFPFPNPLIGLSLLAAGAIIVLGMMTSKVRGHRRDNADKILARAAQRGDHSFFDDSFRH